MGEAVMRTVAVMSGKGGVGKTTTCVGLALSLQVLGFRTAILDLDLENPSLAGKDGVTGLTRNDLSFPGEKILPPEWCGIPVMSLSLLPLDDFEDTPTMVEEETKHFLIRQLFREVDWGDTEIIVVDMPPGSGEEVRGLLQLDLDGAVIVTSPQRISEAAVRKVMVMAEEYAIRLFGVVENAVYGMPGDAGQRLAELFKLPLLARLDWSEDILEGMEDHAPFDPEAFLPIAQVLASTLLQPVPVTNDRRREDDEPAELEQECEGEFASAEIDPSMAAGSLEEPWKAFRDLTDQQWEEMVPLMPPRYRTGRARVDDRAMLNGMLWVQTTRRGWREMPQQYGKWRTAVKRMERWKASGYWNAIWTKAREFGYMMTEGDFDHHNVNAGVLRTGDEIGEPARSRDESPAEVPGSWAEERPDQDVETPARRS